MAESDWVGGAGFLALLVLGFFRWARQQEQEQERVEPPQPPRQTPVASPPQQELLPQLQRPWLSGDAPPVLKRETPRQDEWGPENDNWESSGTEADRKLIARDARIHYRDGRGQESRRTIHVKWIVPVGDDLEVFAFCDLRHANRTFRASRMIEFTDLDTGEEVANPKDHLLAVYAETPQGVAERILKQAQHEVQALLYVGRGEGVLTAKKRGIIVDYLRKCHPSDIIDDRGVADALPSGVPTQKEYKHALGLCAALSEDRRRGLTAALHALAKTKPDSITRAALSFADETLGMAETAPSERSDRKPSGGKPGPAR